MRCEEDEVHGDALVVLGDERDEVGDDQCEPSDDEPEARLERLARLGIDSLAAKETHSTSLRPPWRWRVYAAACRVAKCASGRATSGGCCDGASAPRAYARNVGHGTSVARAQRPARRK